MEKCRKKNNKIIAIFLDFKMAFETIDREIFLNKLYMYGIKGHGLQWFEFYISERTQTTKVNNIKSSARLNECGVPKGSALGALLFIIYCYVFTF